MMKTLIDEFGQNAGKIWRVLNAHGPLKEESLLKTTRLTQDDLWTAIGWLAREGKVCKENNMFKLGETNLTPKIGTDAGRVWNALEKQGEIDIYTLAQTAQITEVDAYCALGWLARENKIVAKKIRAKQNQLKVSLKK
jgi:hypothetical protein